MRMKNLVVVVAVLSTGIAAFLSPAAAFAVPAPEQHGALSSCASAPDKPDATPENRDRFVDLWSPRVADHAWLQQYANRDSVPADIRAEGFHAMDADTQVWLLSCLLDDMLAVAGETPGVAKLNAYLTGLNMIIFGKKQIAELRDQLTEMPPPEDANQLPVHQDMTSAALDNMTQDLVDEPSLTSDDQPESDATAPSTTTTDSSEASTSQELETLSGAPAIVPASSEPVAPRALGPKPTAFNPQSLLAIQPIQILLNAINSLLQLISQIQGQLFTLPGLNILASAFYKICAESPTMPLKCSISLPVGVPIPADVNGDNFPDVTGWLSPLIGGGAVGAKFMVTRLSPGQGKLKAHVFAVYDPPAVKKRIQFGFDGRADTLANRTAATFKLHNVLAALQGDVHVTADVQSYTPGTAQSLTFAIKSLVGGSAGVLPSEEDPMVGSVQMSPVPDSLTVDARLIHTAARDQDIFTVGSSTPTKVNALIDQKSTTTTPKSDRVFTAEVDKLPTSVTVDLVRNGETQTIDYTGSAPIDHVRATDTATPDVNHLGSFTESIYDVHGVPTNVHVNLKGAQDITYTASAKIPEVSFSTRTLVDNVLQQQITAKAHQIPKAVHVTNLTTPDQQAITYDADSELQDVELSMFDLSEAGDKTNLVAKATGIPTHLAFTQTKSTGVYDLSAPGGIDLIEAALTRNDGTLLPLPGDHATVHKVGNTLGLDFRLTGFESAHFDGSENTTVELGLNPGGQSFDAIADLDDPNVLATAHVSQLPTHMAVTLSPTDGTADYAATSVIPLLEAAFTLRDTDTFATVKLTDLPKNIGLTFNTSGPVPAVTYDADSRLGSIEATYQEEPGGLAIHGLISDLPQHMTIGGIDPMVFDARTSASDPAGSSYLGQVLFQYAEDGVFASPPTSDDHIYLDTLSDTHAELQYTGLKLLSVDTSDQELHAEIRNTSPRLLRAYLTTPNLTLTGFIDKVPAQINIDQVDNLVSYRASSPIDQIFTDLHTTSGDALAVDVHGVPGSVDGGPNSIDVLFDGANSRLNWDASGETTSISAQAHLTPATLGGTRAFDAGLTITGIPSHWDATWLDGNVLFQAPDGIGSIAAQVTNHGTYHVLTGDHLSAFFDQPSGNLDASLKISNLTKAGFSKLTGANGGGFEAALNMGNQGNFKFAADVTLTATKLLASGEFNHLPSALTLRSDGGRITYSGNTNPDLTMSVAAGTAAALAATPEPNDVHGVSVRDGAAGGNIAVRAKLRLTGLPTGLDLNSPAGTYTVSGYHPTNDTLVVDVILTELAPDLSLQVQQVVPTATPVDFTFGPFLSSTSGDTHTLSLNYTANQALGSLTAEATYGNTDDAKLVISSIPKTVAVNASFGPAQKSVNVDMDSGISEITASYKKVGAADFAASVKLDDVPKWVHLLLGRATGTDGTTNVSAPDFTFTADAAGLDIEAAVTAEIADPLDVKAAAQLKVTNLGKTVTGALNGRTVNIASTPATEKFLLTAAGSVQINVDLGFDLVGGFIHNTGSLDINIDVKQLTLGFENASTLQLDLGVTTGLKGDYSSFTLGEDTKTVATIQDTLKLVASLPDPFPNINFTVFNIGPDSINFENVISSFRLASNKLDVAFSQNLVDILCCTIDAQLLMRPHAERTTSGPSFTVGQPPSDGNPPAWLITPNPNVLGLSLPDFVIDVVAYFTSPYGHDLSGRLLCDVPLADPFDCTPF
ncbi:hypothetical protein [Nocardioides sp.]|uniref:hypothetical protein n=1 Tax=Nocardioides sp. TaxID=35761 RepID=UPI0031FF1280|nr:hypothetical protein [Nocardioides sp.]